MSGIKEVAKIAGVSVSTVSNALNEKKNVSEETRKKILDICEELGYSTKISSKKGSSNTILFNFSDFDRSFYLKIIKGINDYAEANEFDMMICTNKSCEKYMQSNLTSGCIILDAKMDTETIIRVAKEKYPIVVLDRIIEQPFIKSITIKNYDAMYEMVQGIIARGYKKFAFIGGLEHTDDNKERYQAFLDALENNNLIFNRKHYYNGNYREESGRIAANIMIVSGNIPEVVVCANDNMAIGVINAFKKRGFNIPQDISITGFDDADMAKMIGLTTINIPSYERGYMAAQSIVEMIRGNVDIDTLQITTSIKWRNTVGSKL